MTPREALRAVTEFVDLAVQRRVGSLTLEQRARADALDDRLRQLIDGAKPRPKNIENPSRAQAKPTKPPEPKNLKLSGLAAELDRALDNKEQKKIRDVSTVDLPRSFYTPPTLPAFMSDYYDEGLVPTPTSDLGGARPKSAVRADGSAADLMDEVKVLFGLAAPPKVVPREERTANAVRRSQSETTVPQLGRPTIVHFVGGGTKRGEIAPFEPHTGKLIFLAKDGATEEISLDDVLAVFLGLLKGEDPTDSGGEHMIITLTNDKRVSGRSNDYQEGGASLTLIPEPRRGNIDRVWIPASAVKAIEIP